MPTLAGVQMRTPVAVLVAGTLSAIVYLAVQAIKLTYFHPLSKYPGPRIAAITPLWWVWGLGTERLPFILRDLHRKHGDVVRIGPNELSFVTPEAYQDIHGHPAKGAKRFLKSALYSNNDAAPHVITARDPEVHARQRKGLSYGFSTQALRDQEEIIQSYVNTFVRQIGKLGENGGKALNVSEAFNWLTFDIIGDLGFGESFGGVENGKTHVWVEVLLDSIVNAQTYFLREKIPFMNIIMSHVLPKGSAASLIKHQALTREMALKRLKLGDTGRADFYSHLLRRETLGEEEIISQTSALVIAGSETTASALSGITWFLLNHPKCMAKLQEEIRGAFASEQEITGHSTANLPYLHGVIEESLRMFPPVPISLPRVSPGAMVDGHYIPEGTVVSVTTLNSTYDSRYWRDPDSFLPERWIGDGFGDDKRASQPFCMGQRGCLGINLAYLEMKITLAKLVFRYDWELVGPQERWIENCKMRILWLKADLLVKFRPRITAEDQ
ncbi:cytochrome P450 monooxygenase-like protein [Xylaria nigripes]|nr:cytochrome P450 monooxygenase-like protein [Xylaria nigripes]